MINLEEYFDEEKIKEKRCIVYTPRKKAVYMEEKDGEIYFIKKFMPHGKRAITINLNLKRDQAKHYKYISNILKKLDIPHMEPLEIHVRKKSFFTRESIVVTKYGGETLEHKLKHLDFENQKKLLEEYFWYYKKMMTNGLYITDYNLSGALINSEGKMNLIDFDAYKTKLYISPKFKKNLYEELHKGNDMSAIGGYSKEITEYTKKRVEEIAKELKLI